MRRGGKKRGLFFSDKNRAAHWALMVERIERPRAERQLGIRKQNECRGQIKWAVGLRNLVLIYCQACCCLMRENGTSQGNAGE
jgi:hypothetical protein